MTLIEILGLVSTFILGGGLAMFITIKATKRKAEGEASQSVAQAEVVEAQAESQRIDNSAKLLEMWEKQTTALESRLNLKDEQAIELSKQVKALTEQVGSLSKEVRCLRNITKKMFDLVDSLTADNLEETKEKIKKIHDETK